MQISPVHIARLLCAAAFIALLALRPVTAGEVTLTVETTEPGGQLLVKLIAEADAEGFPGGDGIRQSAPVQPDEPNVAFSFPDVAAGSYAFAVIHDLDGDGDLTQNLLKIPTEPYGFSNNARGAFGPPKFNAAAFEVPAQGEVAVQVKVK